MTKGPKQNMWAQACANVGDVIKSRSRFYTTRERALSVIEDLEAAIEDAKTGDPRAIRYVSEYMRLRMMS